MKIIAPKIPEVHRLITLLISENGGSFQGTHQLCESIPATPEGTMKSLRNRNKYHLIRGFYPYGHQSFGQGRGNKTVWKLTQKGKDYVQSK
jgi:hypothetical protein